MRGCDTARAVRTEYLGQLLPVLLLRLSHKTSLDLGSACVTRMLVL